MNDWLWRRNAAYLQINILRRTNRRKILFDQKQIKAEIALRLRRNNELIKAFS